MKATVLVDNIADKGLDGEWGLSIYIEYGDRKILLDTGASDLFLQNALSSEQIGVSFCQIGILVFTSLLVTQQNRITKIFSCW